ncbi:MAG: hypothetical protein ACI85K_003097, partial [Hyphomicrobiaceae bacterium]
MERFASSGQPYVAIAPTPSNGLRQSRLINKQAAG